MIKNTIVRGNSDRSRDEITRIYYFHLGVIIDVINFGRGEFFRCSLLTSIKNCYIFGNRQRNVSQSSVYRVLF